MGRPTNAELADQDPELEEGTDDAVATALAQFPGSKAVEAVRRDDGHVEVTVADPNKDIHEVTVSEDGKSVLSVEHRVDTIEGATQHEHTKARHHKKNKGEAKPQPEPEPTDAESGGPDEPPADVISDQGPATEGEPSNA
jgi:hypothetical protein